MVLFSVSRHYGNASVGDVSVVLGLVKPTPKKGIQCVRLGPTTCWRGVYKKRSGNACISPFKKGKTSL